MMWFLAPLTLLSAYAVFMSSVLLPASRGRGALAYVVLFSETVLGVVVAAASAAGVGVGGAALYLVAVPFLFLLGKPVVLGLADLPALVLPVLAASAGPVLGPLFLAADYAYAALVLLYGPAPRKYNLFLKAAAVNPAAALPLAFAAAGLQPLASAIAFPLFGLLLAVGARQGLEEILLAEGIRRPGRYNW